MPGITDVRLYGTLLRRTMQGVVDPLIKAWEADGHPEPYPVGSWGPQAADDLVASGGAGRWIVSGDEPGTA